jgi:hypothetical protein
MVRLLPWAVVVYAVMLFVFMQSLSSDDSTAAFIWMWITIGIALFPTSFYRICWKQQWDTQKVRAGDTKEYEEVALSFLDDFDRANPVTQREGWEAYLKLVEKKKLLDQKMHQELLKQINTSQGLLGSYGKGFGHWQNFGRPVHPLQGFQQQMRGYFENHGMLAQMQTISHQRTNEAKGAVESTTGGYGWAGQVLPQAPPPLQVQSNPWAVPPPPGYPVQSMAYQQPPAPQYNQRVRR